MLSARRPPTGFHRYLLRLKFAQSPASLSKNEVSPMGTPVQIWGFCVARPSAVFLSWVWLGRPCSRRAVFAIFKSSGRMLLFSFLERMTRSTQKEQETRSIYREIW